MYAACMDNCMFFREERPLIPTFWCDCGWCNKVKLISLPLPLHPRQRSVPSWWSSSSVWTSSVSWGCSCCRTCRTSSGRRRRSRWTTAATWRSWPRGSSPRRAVPRTIYSSMGTCTKHYHSGRRVIIHVVLLEDDQKRLIFFFWKFKERKNISLISDF